MKKIIYNSFLASLLITSFVFLSCDDDITQSLYEAIPPVDELPVSMHFNFDENIHGIPYAITCDNNNSVYVSVSGQGIKKIIKQTPNDTLVGYAPKGGETFFSSLTFVPDSNIIIAARRVTGIFQIKENTAPATFVSSAQGLEGSVVDVEFDNSRKILWAGGNTTASQGSKAVIHRITLGKDIKKFHYLTGSISALKPTQNNIYVAFRDTLNQELVWKFPIISNDSIGAGELFFNFTASVDTLARISDIAVSENDELFIFSNTGKFAVTTVRSANSFETAFSGLIVGKIYSFTWGTDNFAYFSNIIGEENSDVWKINMSRNKAP